MKVFLKHRIHRCKKKSSSKQIVISFLALSIIIFVSLLSGVTSYAAPEDQKVYDFYGLFSENEVTELEKVAKEYGDKGQVDIVFITEGSLGNKTRKSYIEDFYDQHGFGYNQKYGDTALILVNMDPNDRGVEIQGYGNAEYYINNDRIEHILDDIVPMLTDGEYYNAMEEFAKQSAYYMKEEKGVNTSPVSGETSSSINYGETPYSQSSNNYGESSYDGPSNYYGEKNILLNPFVQLGISIIIGAVSVGIMAYGSGGRVTVNNRTYMDGKNSNVVASRDDYIRTVTTRVRRPTNNNGGGRSSGGGGISSGGHSHSGGGRGF